MPTMPYEDSMLLQKANRKIATLKEDIRRLSADLQRKNSLLSSFIDMAAGQSRHIASHHSRHSYLGPLYYTALLLFDS